MSGFHTALSGARSKRCLWRLIARGGLGSITKSKIVMHTPGTAPHQLRDTPARVSSVEKNAGPNASPRLPELMNTAIHPARRPLIPDVARVDACGWNEAIPDPPSSTMITSHPKLGAAPSDALKIPATAGARP